MGLMKSVFRALFSTSNKRGLNTRIRNGYSQYQKSDGTWDWSHRRAAEKKVGGKIGPDRVVHHRDGNRRNNSWWNLWIMQRKKHSALHAKKRRFGM
jgi:hypothetical protein